MVFVRATVFWLECFALFPFSGQQSYGGMVGASSQDPAAVMQQQYNAMMGIGGGASATPGAATDAATVSILT